MRLSQRMKDILRTLNNSKESAPNIEETQKYLQERENSIARDPDIISKAEAARQHFFYRNMSQKYIIINLELQAKYNKLINEYGEVKEELTDEFARDHHEDEILFSYRHYVSLDFILL